MNDRSTTTSATQTKVVIGLLTVVMAVVLISLFSRGYGKVSYQAYQVATALYGACLSKSTPRVEKIQVMLINGSPDLDAEKISPQERRWLQAVIDEAENGQWKPAAASAKKIMEAQNQ